MEFRLIACGLLVSTVLAMPMAVAAEQRGAKSAGRKVKPFFGKPWLLGAHRGGAFMWPENTVVAFEAAAKRWPDIILEGDAQLTRDGHVILLHDATIDRTTDGRGLAANMTLEQIKRLDAGYRFTTDDGKTFPYRGKGVRIATLDEALAACPNSRFEIELKPGEGITKPVIQAIKRARAQGRVLLASFDPRIVHGAHKLAPEIANCYNFIDGMDMLSKLRKGGDFWASYRPTADVLSLMQRMLEQFKLTPDEIRAIQAKGIYFQMHTPNNRERINKMLDLNPDSILTDRPDLLAEIIAERAKSKPK